MVKKTMSTKRSYDKYLKNTRRSITLNTMDVTGIAVTGHISNQIPAGPGTAIGANVISTGYALGGMTGLANTAFGKGGVLDSMKMLDTSSKKRKRR